MYGLVNAALRELIVAKHGLTAWERLRDEAGLQADTFALMDPYPDEITQRMVQQGAAILGMSTAELLHSFGEFWVEYTDREGYGSLFEIAGNSLPDFLLSLDELHVRVGRNFPRLKPPSFRFDVIDRSTMRMHYLTSRAGLCPFVTGLLAGLSRRFQTPIEVRQDECTLRGDDHCVFFLQFGEVR